MRTRGQTDSGQAISRMEEILRGPDFFVALMIAQFMSQWLLILPRQYYVYTERKANHF